MNQGIYEELVTKLVAQKINELDKRKLGKYRAIYLGSFLPHAELYLISQLLKIFSNKILNIPVVIRGLIMYHMGPKIVSL